MRQKKRILYLPTGAYLISVSGGGFIFDDVLVYDIPGRRMTASKFIRQLCLKKKENLSFFKAINNIQTPCIRADFEIITVRQKKKE